MVEKTYNVADMKRMFDEIERVNPTSWVIAGYDDTATGGKKGAGLKVAFLEWKTLSPKQLASLIKEYDKVCNVKPDFSKDKELFKTETTETPETPETPETTSISSPVTRYGTVTKAIKEVLEINSQSGQVSSLYVKEVIRELDNCFNQKVSNDIKNNLFKVIES